MAPQTVQKQMVASAFANFRAEPLNPYLYFDQASCSYLKNLEVDWDYRRLVFTSGRCITCQERSILLNLLVQTHTTFRYQQESLYLAVAIVDRFLQCEDALCDDLKLICLASLHLASRFENSSKSLNTYCFVLGRNATSEKLLTDMVSRIQYIISFTQCPPLAVHFLYQYIRVRSCDDSIRAMAEFFLELSFYDPELSSLLPSILAASAFILSLRMSNSLPWSNALTSYVGYSKGLLRGPVIKLARHVFESEGSDNLSVIQKYATQDLYFVSRRVYENPNKKAVLEQIADGE